MMKKTSLILKIILFLISFSAHSQTLNTGPWKFELRTTYAEIPFLIKIKKNKGKYYGILDNGKETIKLPRIRVTKSTISIPIQNYEMSLEMNPPKYGVMGGFLVRHNKNPKVKTPVTAFYDEHFRFPQKKKDPKIDLNGRWGIDINEDGKISKGIILFEQNGNKLNGSLLTPTGDYRYMEGYVSGEEFEAASFDGVYNYLVKGSVKKDKITGKILADYVTKFEGKKDPEAKLPDAYNQTKLKKLRFNYPNIGTGKYVSLNDAKFKNKPVIVQIFGSWCPNCQDEMNFLIPWYKENQKRGVEVVALAFERSVSHKAAKIQLKKVQKRNKVPYPLLHVGSTSQHKPAELIRGIENFISFPTTIFLNKKHEVVKVHAGFTGPSTGEFYENWKKDFEKTVNELLK